MIDLTAGGYINTPKMRGNHNTRELEAASKRLIPNAGDAVRDRDAREIFASLKRPVPNARDAGRNCITSGKAAGSIAFRLWQVLWLLSAVVSSECLQTSRGAYQAPCLSWWCTVPER